MSEPSNNGSVGPMSEKTRQNIKRAKAWGQWVGPWHIEGKLWTGNLLFKPRYQWMLTEFFNEGPVSWHRWYWLTLGLSWYKVLPERRKHHCWSSQCPLSPYHDRRGVR